MTDEEFLGKLEVLTAKADRIEKDRIPQIEGTRARLDDLIADIEPRDPYFADHVRRFTSRSNIEIVVGRIRWFLREGNLAAAEQSVSSWNAHYDHIKDLLMLAAVKSRDDLSKGGAKGGRQPKRRRWADALAQYLAVETIDKEEAWESIPEVGTLCLENFGDDLELYRDGETLVCIEAGEERSLKKSTFMARYFPPKQ
jgi:hypothetical protein